MRLHTLTTTHWLGLRGTRTLDLRGAPVTLVAGPNGSGKSSIAHAVAYALTGALPRGITKKSDLAALISEGATSAAVRVEGDTCIESRILPGGEHPDSIWQEPVGPALPYVLDMHAFSAADPAERRKLLFKVAGVKSTQDAIRERLEAKGRDPKRLDLVLPLLRVGFETAETDARERAREAKGAWRAVTKETWGSLKGETWEAPVPAVEHDAAELAWEVEKLASTLATQTEARGRLAAALDAAQARTARIGELRPVAAGYAAGAEALKEARARLTTLTADLAAARHEIQAAEQARPQTFYPCPDCGAALIFDGKALRHYDPPAETQALPLDLRQKMEQRVASLERSLAGAAAKVKTAEAQVRSADEAAHRLKELEDAQVGATDPAALVALDASLGELRSTEAARRQALEAARRAQEARAAARHRTQEAAQHHADVLAWEALAADLSPAGIPAELLADAMAPVDAELARQASASGWPRVRLSAEDMSLSAGHRPHALLSESEQWRCDAQVTAALAVLSGIRFVLLDRLDVLDLPGRSRAVGWLARLAAEGMQALVLGTLKEPPAKLPPSFRCEWLGEQQVQQRAA